jgi:CheY-like chemotaxis protein
MDGYVVDILLVDDNEDDTFMTEEAFADAKLVNIVRVLRDGEEAMAYIRREGIYKNASRPGLVLLDINMPKKNGFEVLSELKDDPKFSTIPVVMLTTSQREEDVVRSYAGGACTFISKPVNMEKLKEIASHFALYWAMIARVPTLEGTP